MVKINDRGPFGKGRIIDLSRSAFGAIGEKMVLRLKSPLSQNRIAALNADFADMLSPGGAIRLSDPLAEESGETEIRHLPRLVIDFNRKHYGRLKQLIDAINVD